MTDASSYPITFGYKATDNQYYGPTGSIGLFHRGEDRAMPVGTPVVVNGVQIGLSGNGNGLYGAHLHIGRFVNGLDTNPGGRGFMLDGATVFDVLDDYSDVVNGKFVRIVDSSGALYVYLHMSQVDVKKGQVLKGESMESTKDLGKAVYHSVHFREPESDAAAIALGQAMQKDPRGTLEKQKDSPEWRSNAYKVANFDRMVKENDELRKSNGVNRDTALDYVTKNLK